MTERPRAVVDTNLVVSAELLRVLAYPKFHLSEAEREDLLGDHLPFCTTIRMPSELPAVPACRDPFDMPFLELAIAGDADYLVTGDKDLLSLAKRFPVAIVAVETFLTMLVAEG